MASSSVLLEKSQLKNVPGVAVHQMFHSTKVPRRDDFLLCSERVVNESASFESIKAWSAKFFCFFRIRSEKGDLSTGKDDVSLNLSNDFSHIQTEHCFIQF